MKKIAIYSISILFFSVSFFSGIVRDVSADAWWGEGYQTPEWVLKHGGTIIKYTVIGTSHPKDYKAMMFRDGKYVEVEFGKSAKFDDAKNGTYLINFYKCHKGCMDQKFYKKTKIRDKDKLIASISIVARPGQVNNLVFNASNATVTVVGRSGGYKKIDLFAQQCKIAKKNKDKICMYTQVQKQKVRLDRLSLLSSTINQEKFYDKNRAMGILPQFLVKK